VGGAATTTTTIVQEVLCGCEVEVGVADGSSARVRAGSKGTTANTATSTTSRALLRDVVEGAVVEVVEEDRCASREDRSRRNDLQNLPAWHTGACCGGVGSRVKERRRKRR
jgi:hypothetical protein